MSDQEVNPVVEEVKQDFSIVSKDGTILYTSSQAELDDCFYSIIALMSWTKTFSIGPKLKLTFNTISDDEKLELLGSMKKWAEANDASSNMFDQYLNKVNLAYYLSFIEMNGDGINLREKKLEDRIKFLGTMAEGALQLYGTYLFVFLEIIRKTLVSQVNIKNS